jgi:hypothetical protein
MRFRRKGDRLKLALEGGRKVVISVCYSWRVVLWLSTGRSSDDEKDE